MDLFPVSFPLFSFSSFLCPFHNDCFLYYQRASPSFCRLLNRLEIILWQVLDIIKSIKNAKKQSNHKGKHAFVSGNHVLYTSLGTSTQGPSRKSQATLLNTEYLGSTSRWYLPWLSLYQGLDFQHLLPWSQCLISLWPETAAQLGVGGRN